MFLPQSQGGVGGYQSYAAPQQAQAPSSNFQPSQLPEALQPYVNRMTNNASSALYGGLQGYQPQSLFSGDAGGEAIQTTAPQFNLQSAMQGQEGGLFGNRAWMKG